MGAKRCQRTYDLATKTRAQDLRKAGYTYREISEALGGDIPRNTISGWGRDIELTQEQQARIQAIQEEAAARGREKAAALNKEQKLRSFVGWKKRGRKPSL